PERPSEIPVESVLSEVPIERVPSPVLDPIHDTHPIPHVISLPSTRPPVPKEAYTLISLQSYDGSFAPSSRLGALVGMETLGKAAEMQVDGNIWATAVAVAYLKHHLGAQPDLLDALLSKALEYVEGRGSSLLFGRDFMDLVATAGQSLGQG
ncbi:hypothetical protein K503DRAFT_786444, partial [Rhizopogon vinicolor AM-OR11-026]